MFAPPLGENPKWNPDSAEGLAPMVFINKNFRVEKIIRQLRLQ